VHVLPERLWAEGKNATQSGRSSGAGVKSSAVARSSRGSIRAMSEYVGPSCGTQTRPLALTPLNVTESVAPA